MHMSENTVIMQIQLSYFDRIFFFFYYIWDASHSQNIFHT